MEKIIPRSSLINAVLTSLIHFLTKYHNKNERNQARQSLKHFKSRSKAVTELQRLQAKVQDAVENKDGRLRVERLATSCDEAMTKMFAKHEQFFELAG